MASLRALRFGLVAVLGLSAIACGGGGGTTAGSSSSGSSSGGGTSSSSGSSSSGSSSSSSSSSSSGGSTSSSSGGTGAANVVSVIIDGGPMNESANTLFTTVTVCVPGSTTNCQIIDHIQVDTGSYGLRLLAPVLTLTLPPEILAGGASLAECTQFVDGFSWGPVALADMTIGGETAHSLPVQVIGDPRFTNIPADCSNTGGTEEDTVATFGANGIIGIGPFELDCGDCNVNTHDIYFSCATASTTCTDTTVPNNMQVPNPVTSFAVDNNGSIIQLPAVTGLGAVTLSGTLTFGIDTQSNNVSGTQTVLTVDGNSELLMTYKTQTFANSFIDSGSNGIYFTDSTIPQCTEMGITTFFCPTSTLAETVSIEGQNGIMANNLPFNVANTNTMLSTPPSDTYNVLPELAGSLPAGNAGSFDYGLPFFYGRRVAVAVEGDITTVGTGPYIAF
jgi:Protein of unknown function (DUF3443)